MPAKPIMGINSHPPLLLNSAAQKKKKNVPEIASRT
jgi:hypothetical protein